MNANVTATGMKVQAQAETGIVIANYDHSGWADKANASKTAITAMYPSSTSDVTTWYHNTSNDANQATGAAYVGDYVELSLDDGVSGGSNYYLVNRFYIKSSSGSDLTNTRLVIKSVESALNPNITTGASENLDKAIRIAVKVGTLKTGATQTNNVYGRDQYNFDSNTYIYAPAYTTAPTYNIAGSTTNSVTPKIGTVSSDTTITSIPASDNGLMVEIYVWFEGEDTNCKSANLTSTLDELNVSVVFTTSAVTGG